MHYVVPTETDRLGVTDAKMAKTYGHADDSTDKSEHREREKHSHIQ